MMILDAIMGETGFLSRATHSGGTRLDPRDDHATSISSRLAELQPGLAPLAARYAASRSTTPCRSPSITLKSWPKATRLLDPEYVADFSRMGFFRRIREQFGPTAIISHDELNWRLVRPNQPADIGPSTPTNGSGTPATAMVRCRRVRSLQGLDRDPHRAGGERTVREVGSHRRDWQHHFEEKDGVRKPVFDEDPDAIGMELLPLAAGQHGDVPRRTAARRRREPRPSLPREHRIDGPVRSDGGTPTCGAIAW